MEQRDTVYGAFRAQALAHPDAPAVLEPDRTVTFRELLDLTDRIAGTFPAGVRSVGVVMSHRAEMIAAMLAVLRCGARYIPAEPSFPTGRIAFMMQESEAEFLLTEKACRGRAPGVPEKCVDCEICASRDAAVDREPAAVPESPAYVLYTSGTTGRPKGVCVTNRNVCHYARAFAAEFRPGPGDVMLQNSVCTFDIFVEEVFATLLNGAAVAIPGAQEHEDLRTLMRFAAKTGVTMISAFPYLFAELNRDPSLLPGSVRLLISGGDVLRASYVDRLLDRAAVYNTYGPSETTVCAAYYRCNGGTVLPDGTYPIGKPVLGAEIRVLDGSGAEVPAGETGELVIAGGGVSDGYIGGRAEENRAFLTLPDGRRAYRSGDYGYLLPDGNLAFLHRRDSQIMILGKRVEVQEVASRLHQCRNVRQAVVRADTDEQGLAYMTAYLVPEKAPLRASEIRRALAEYLPDYMIPEYLVEVSEIPLTENGKPDLARLPTVLKAGGGC